MNFQHKKSAFIHKKIGIWGFGIVGQSALSYFDTQQVASIEILDTKSINLPRTQTPTISIIQNEYSINFFLEHNDFILASPGIKLHDYQNFAHKFINELDLLQENFSMPIIAITGTIGKTSITHLLEKIIKHIKPNSIAAGNIGYPMLSLIQTNKPDLSNSVAIIELSSFQLQSIKKFAPELAIITNFFTNHLDHHKSIDEYFSAKCNIFKNQNDNQKALIPLNLVKDIQTTLNTTIKKNWILFSPTPATQQEIKKYRHQIIYYLDNRIVYKIIHGKIEKIFDCTILPPITFDTNWLIIIAACCIHNIPLTTINIVAQEIQLPEHRLQKVGSYNNSTFYNDSKSTVWQATLQAVLAMGNKPIKLFLGGLSKGADRTPLLEKISDKNIEVYAFGKESQQIAELCQKFNIKHHKNETLDAAFHLCTKNLSTPHEILFSPGGSSFDLFADYKARGDHFTKLVQNYCNIS